VIERGQHLRLAAQSRDAAAVKGERFWQDFQRDIAIEFRAAGTIHLAHAARANGRDDFIRPTWVPDVTATFYFTGTLCFNSWNQFNTTWICGIDVAACALELVTTRKRCPSGMMSNSLMLAGPAS
jgi:hypothetical protein